MPVGDNVVRIMCPNLTCKRVLAVPAHARGKLVRCKGCGMNIRIPASKPAPAAAPAAAQATPPAAQSAPAQPPKK
ncbi:MAG TPA: hypothetical protein VG711_01800 [Phycisphaerales bacterium]|nr:hypothetical protein [Phycisphaerales bacterium]